MTQATSTLPYNIPSIDLENVTNYISLRVTVDGFWSDVINITIQRKTSDYNLTSASPLWTFEVSHSSGGVDNNVDNLTASENFGLANIAAVKFCREWQSNIDKLEEAYTKCMVRIAAEYDEEQRIRLEKLAADPEIGEDIAKANIKKMIEDFEAGKMPVITASDRTFNNKRIFKPIWKGAYVRFFHKSGVYCSDVYSSKEIIKMLASMSLKSMDYSYAD